MAIVKYHSYLLFLFFKSKMVKGVGVSSMSKQVSIILFFGFSLILESSCFGNVILMLFFYCVDQPILGRWKTKSKRG